MKRNINGLLGFTMKGTDGEIGKVRDFYFDDETWDIRHLILKTGSWFSSRDVLISPKAILESNWENGILPVNLTMKQMLESPEIDTDKPGHVVDYIMDDRTWKILYLAIDTHQWIGGQKLLLPVGKIRVIQWENASVYVDENMDSIKKSPLFDRAVYSI